MLCFCGESREISKAEGRIVKGRSPKEKTGKWGNFSQVGDPPPLPPVWEWHVCEKKIMVYFAFQDHRNIFGFYKNVHFWVVLWFVEVGTGDPTPPPQAKNSHFILFC